MGRRSGCKVRFGAAVTLPYDIEDGRVVLSGSRLCATVLQEIDGKQTLLVFVPEDAEVVLMGADSGLYVQAPGGYPMKDVRVEVVRVGLKPTIEQP